MAFSLGQPMLFPKDRGVPYGALTMEEVLKASPKLTEEEKRHPHAKYLNLVPAKLAEEHEEALRAAPMDPEYGFEMKDYGAFMNNTGYCKAENGYCVLPSGVTYAAAMLKQEGLCDEVIDLYNKDFADFHDLFYKIWFPNDHYISYTNGCLEDFGFGRMHMKFIKQIEPEDLGIRREDILKNDPNCIYIGGTSSIGYNLDSNHPDRLERNCIMFYYRKTEYGREARIRLWYGIGIDDEGFHLTIPEAEEAEHIAKCTMHHVMQEYTNDRVLETAFYNDKIKGDK